MTTGQTLCSRRRPLPLGRRDFLAQCGGGFGLLALSQLLGQDGLLAAEHGLQLRDRAASGQPEAADR